MNTRLEIFVDGIWQNLELWDRASIKYNKIVNKIASINTREISHSNTLSIPPNFHNRQVLGINIFNSRQMSKALNSRYDAKYYIEEKLVQEGFIVINRANDKDIKINFIDQSLELVDNWGDTEFRDLLNNPSLSIPQDYRDSILELKNYELPINQIAQNTSLVGSRGYKLCLFPNNLNCIGDKYMVDKDENRPDNTINPYQSRPLFNAKSIFDLACEAYGYEADFDESVDWEEVAKTFIVPSGMNDNFVDEGITNRFSTVPYEGASRVIDSTFDKIVVLTTPSRSFKPNDITGWNSPEIGWSTDYFSLESIFRADLESQPNGLIRYSSKYTSGSTTNASNAYGVWRNSTNTSVVFKTLFVDNIKNNGSEITYDINKIQLFNPPANNGEFLGIISTIETNGTILNYQVTETFLPIESVSYDERGQFVSQAIDLTYAAPNNTVKELIVGLMSQFGILMDINNNTKVVKFFNYSRYLEEVFKGNITDISEYLLEYEPFEYNTDYGNGFGKLNEIGLSDPFKGNTFFQRVENQGTDSKLKDFERNLSKRFKDVSQVNRIPNSSTPYIEYTNTGLGLVRNNGIVENLTQIRFFEDVDDGNPTFETIGNKVITESLENVKFNFLPIGISEWYRIVSESVKANPKFLLPIELVRNLDLTIPVYIEQMGGYYIIEEISEYKSPQDKVIIKVIKLIDGAEFNDDFSNAFNI